MELLQEERARNLSTVERSVSTSVDRPACAWVKEALPGIALAVIFLLTLVRFFHIVDRYSVDVFFGDHWTFEDSTLFQHHSLLEVFRWQHGPHRQGLGGLLMMTIEPMIHWDQRYETFGIAGIIACACLAALWLKYRLFGKFEYSDIIIPLLFFSPVQYETLFGANNPSHGPLPLLLVVLYCIAWTIQSERWKFTAVVVLDLLLIYTGFGLFMGVITPALLGLDFYRGRSRLSLLSSVLSVILFASFFVGYRYNPAVKCFSPQLEGPSRYLVFVALMFSSFVKLYPIKSTVAPGLLVGSVLLLAVSGVAARASLKVLRSGTCALKPLVVAILLVYSLLFCFAAAYGRTCMGPAPAPRYLIYLVLAFFGMYLGSLSVTAALERRECICAVFALAFASSGWISGYEARKMALIHQQRQTWKQCYLSTHNIEECDARSKSFIYYLPEPDDLKPKLDYLERHRLSLFR